MKLHLLGEIRFELSMTDEVPRALQKLSHRNLLTVSDVSDTESQWPPRIFGV
jgi:hypothetical protein